MTLFSSRPPFNDDPFPYFFEEGGRTSEKVFGDERYEPRPEHDRPKHNAANPILTEFRELHAQTGNDLWTDAYLSSSDLIEDWESYDLAHWNHAMDVFTRILRMRKVLG